MIEAQDVYDHLQLDLIHLSLCPSGNKYVIMVVDLLSKYAWGKAIPSKHASQVVRLIAELVQEYGPFKILQSDNGTEFANKEVEEYCNQHNIGELCLNVCVCVCVCERER